MERAATKGREDSVEETERNPLEVDKISFIAEVVNFQLKQI